MKYISVISKKNNTIAIFANKKSHLHKYFYNLNAQNIIIFTALKNISNRMLNAQTAKQ